MKLLNWLRFDELNMREIIIPDKRKVFVGVEISSKDITYGFVNSYGKLITVDSQRILKEPGNEAGALIGSIRGIRGELNLRFKNFVGICICFTKKENKVKDFEQQLYQNLNIPVYVEERDYLRQLGEDWFKKLGDKIDLEGGIKNMNIDLNVIYGGAKLVIDKTSTTAQKARTKEEVIDYLFKLFPDFVKVWNSGDTLFRDEDGSYTYHGLFSEFSVYFRDNFNNFSNQQLEDLFTHIEDWEREEDKNYNQDDAQLLSNAVFTCFLENIASEELTKRLKSFMGKKSLEYYSHYDH